MRLKTLVACLLTGFVSCSGSPERFDAPRVDTFGAAAKALDLYDTDKNGSLNQDELAKCPAILARIKDYDLNTNNAVEPNEITMHLDRLLNRAGGTALTATVRYNGKNLNGANVELAPEPFLGDEVNAATGVTNAAGRADLSIPSELIPEHLRRLKLVNYGVFKVRVTHPSVQIPAKYNTDTELGYETEVGNPNVSFNLTGK